MPASHFRYAMRSLARSPGFAFSVVLSLALGIGANAAIYSVVNGLLFHPTGMSDPGRLVAPRINYKKLNLDKIGMSATDFADVRDQPKIFSHAAMVDVEGLNYTGGEAPERMQGAFVTWQWFDVLGRAPFLGRDFQRSDDQPGANHVAVLSFSTWNRLFGGDRQILGRTIELNRTPYRVIGVMPEDFHWPSEADVWIPIGLPASAYGPGNRFNESYFAVARLARGVSYERAQSFMPVLSKRVLDQVPFARDSQWSMVIEPFTEYNAGDLKKPMFLLLGAVAFVLLIVCSNIAGLMLARGIARGREFAIRTALGAGRMDLIYQAFTEISVLAVFGTAVGLCAAFGLLRALLSVARVELGTELFVNVDGHVLAFTACVGILSALVFGVMPAWHISRLGEQHAELKEGGRSGMEGQARQTLRSALVAGQIALALVLLVGAGLLLKTLANLKNVKAGFDPRGVMTASVALPDPEYGEEKQIAFFRGAVDRLSQAPGVDSAAAASIVPFAGGDPTASFDIEGRVVPRGDPGFHGSSRHVSPEYFRTMKIPLLAGRDFNDGDTRNGQAVAIIDADLARHYWPNESPIGQRLRRGNGAQWAMIVGIVGHVKQSSVAADAGRGTYYFCFYQQPISEAFLVARGKAPAAQLRHAIRSAVRAVDPGQAVFDVRSMQERLALALGPQQFATQILMVFGGAALLIALIGLYGVISYNVARRTREIGVRTALGAERWRILALIMSQAMRLVVIGIVAGFIACLLAGRFAAAQLFEVSPGDRQTFVVAAFGLAAAGLLASLIPAWRAARVDPLTALRNE